MLKYVPKDARYLDDPWQATLTHSLDARNFVEDVYRLDLRGAFRNKDDQEAREFASIKGWRPAPLFCVIWHTQLGSKAQNQCRK